MPEVKEVSSAPGPSASTLIDKASLAPDLLFNLVNVVEQEPQDTCARCTALLPSSRQLLESDEESTIEHPLDYQLEDCFPSLPTLKAGCALCQVIRDSILLHIAQNCSFPADNSNKEPGMDSRRDESSLQTRNIRIQNAKLIPKIERFVLCQLPPFHDWNTAGCIKMTLITEDGLSISSNAKFLPPKLNFDFSLDIYEQPSDEPAFRIKSSHHSLSDQNTELIRKWIDDCKRSHPICGTKNAWTPTRLLKIDSSVLRLVEFDENDHSCPNEVYAALSYVWGAAYQDSMLLKTVRSNIDEMKRGIALHMLPKTLTDAVLVCRQVHIQYLWIDVLCITQDLPQGVQHEIEHMDKVYRHADLTIAATSSISADSGFVERDLQNMIACKTKYRSEPDSLIITPSTLSRGLENLRYGHIEGSLWDRRGWTFQERTLSTRVLHFARNMLYFECCSGIKSESDREGKDWLLMQPVRGVNGGLASMWPRQENLATKEWYKHWEHAVQNLNRRQFTFRSDKLRAILGLANVMGSQVADTYLPYAGIWCNELPRQLLWTIYPHPYDNTKYREIAPTWSWASIDAGVIWKWGSYSAEPDTGFKIPARRKQIVQILNLQSQSETQNVDGATGQPKKCLLQVSALVRDIIGFSTTNGIYPKLQTFSSTGERVDFAQAVMDLNVNGMTKDDEVEPGQLIYMHTYDSEPGEYFTGLVLRKTVDREQWERVGVASVFFHCHIRGKTEQRLFMDWDELAREDQVREIIII